MQKSTSSVNFLYKASGTRATPLPNQQHPEFCYTVSSLFLYI